MSADTCTWAAKWACVLILRPFAERPPLPLRFSIRRDCSAAIGHIQVGEAAKSAKQHAAVRFAVIVVAAAAAATEKSTVAAI